MQDYHTPSTTQVQPTEKKLLHQENLSRSERTITIWVHGTRALSRTLFPNFFRSVAGLNNADVYKKNNNLLTIARTLNEANPDMFPEEDIFFFGWSGVLSDSARRKAAKQLYEHILSIIEKYKNRYKIIPKIRIITHSHGGNVTLYLAEERKERDVQIIIDQLILLACPVQKKTSHLVKDKMFKNIWSFYSKLDLIQVLDPQGVYDIKDRWENGNKEKKEDIPLFSERCFPEQDNLQQVSVKINGRPITHLEFVLKKFVRRLPDMNKESLESSL